jgi:nucleotidyltransferase/DNA polymerase involved in DNA repair
MDVSIGNAFPATKVPQGQLAGQQGQEHGISRRFIPRMVKIDGMAHRLSRRAVRWLANRRVWSTRVPAAALSPETQLAGELQSVRREILARTGAEIAIGASRSRGVARTASRMAGTTGVLVVAAGREREFLAPLPLRQLEGVSEGISIALKASGLVTIGELQRVPKAALQAEFGQAEGQRLWLAARGMECAFDVEGGAATLRQRPGIKPFSASGLVRALQHAALLTGWGRLGANLRRRLRLMAGVAR